MSGEEVVLTLMPTTAVSKRRRKSRTLVLAYICPNCRGEVLAIFDDRTLCHDDRFKWPYKRKRCCHFGEIVGGVLIDGHSHRLASKVGG